MRKKIFLAGLFLFFTVICHADYVQTVGDGASVDWTNGIITAKGVGFASEFSDASDAEKKLQARQAAKTDAIRKLAEAVNNIRVDGKTFVKDFQVQNELVKTSVQAFVKNCAEKDVKFLPEGRCEVVVQASLTGEGSLSHIIYDNLQITDSSGVSNEEEQTQDVAQQEDEGKVITASLETEEEDAVEPEGKNADVEEEVIDESAGLETVSDVSSDTGEAELVKSEEDEEKKEQKKTMPGFVSGLIVNAKNTSAKPAISPSIISDTGEKLYNLTVPTRKFRTRQGLASYTAKVHTAENNNRVTKTPYVIEAMKIVQENPCIIMVSQDEFNEFKRLRGSDIVLERARVIIVVGK